MRWGEREWATFGGIRKETPLLENHQIRVLVFQFMSSDNSRNPSMGELKSRRHGGVVSSSSGEKTGGYGARGCYWHYEGDATEQESKENAQDRIDGSPPYSIFDNQRLLPNRQRPYDAWSTCTMYFYPLICRLLRRRSSVWRFAVSSLFSTFLWWNWRPIHEYGDLGYSL